MIGKSVASDRSRLRTSPGHPQEEEGENRAEPAALFRSERGVRRSEPDFIARVQGGGRVHRRVSPWARVRPFRTVGKRGSGPTARLHGGFTAASRRLHGGF